MSYRKSGRSPKITMELANEIRELWRNTDLTQHAIASKLKINQGRVSEVVNGVRFAESEDNIQGDLL